MGLMWNPQSKFNDIVEAYGECVSYALCSHTPFSGATTLAEPQSTLCSLLHSFPNVHHQFCT